MLLGSKMTMLFAVCVVYCCAVQMNNGSMGKTSPEVTEEQEALPIITEDVKDINAKELMVEYQTADPKRKQQIFEELTTNLRGVSGVEELHKLMADSNSYTKFPKDVEEKDLTIKAISDFVKGNAFLKEIWAHDIANQFKSIGLESQTVEQCMRMITKEDLDDLEENMTMNYNEMKKFLLDKNRNIKKQVYLQKPYIVIPRDIEEDVLSEMKKIEAISQVKALEKEVIGKGVDPNTLYGTDAFDVDKIAILKPWLRVKALEKEVSGKGVDPNTLYGTDAFDVDKIAILEHRLRDVRIEQLLIKLGHFDEDNKVKKTYTFGCGFELLEGTPKNDVMKLVASFETLDEFLKEVENREKVKNQVAKFEADIKNKHKFNELSKLFKEVIACWNQLEDYMTDDERNRLLDVKEKLEKKIARFLYEDKLDGFESVLSNVSFKTLLQAKEKGIADKLKIVHAQELVWSKVGFTEKKEEQCIVFDKWDGPDGENPEIEIEFKSFQPEKYKELIDTLDPKHKEKYDEKRKSSFEEIFSPKLSEPIIKRKIDVIQDLLTKLGHFEEDIVKKNHTFDCGFKLLKDTPKIDVLKDTPKKAMDELLNEVTKLEKDNLKSALTVKTVL